MFSEHIFLRTPIIIIIITLFIVDGFQMYKLKCENYNNLQYIYTYIKIHKSQKYICTYIHAKKKR